MSARLTITDGVLISGLFIATDDAMQEIWCACGGRTCCSPARIDL